MVKCFVVVIISPDTDAFMEVRVTEVASVFEVVVDPNAKEGRIFVSMTEFRIERESEVDISVLECGYIG